MEKNREMPMKIAHLSWTFGLVLLLCVAHPTNAQTTAQPSSPAASPSNTTPPDDDTTRRQLASMDRFLDSHPEIAEQLRKDPSLIDNRQWVDNHPDLQAFLESHREIREEFRENPNAFMRAENRYDHHENDWDRDGDLNHRQIASMDRFFDRHPEIAEQLRKDPSLINNQRWVDNHPDLQAFLQSHREIREEFRENPCAFMASESRYDRHEDRDRDGDRREIANFGEFLRGHASTADALSKDPSLANRRDFLQSNPDLRDYLQAHPALSTQLSANPQAVMTSPALAHDATVSPKMGVTGAPDVKSPAAKPMEKPMDMKPPSTKPDEMLKPEPH